MTTITGTKAPTRQHSKPRTPECELRRSLSDAWHQYLTRLARVGAADAETCRLLDEVARAAVELRDVTSANLGII